MQAPIAMSTTKQRNADEVDDEPSFSDVQSNRDVCGNCFRRTHHTFERNYAVDTVKVDDFEWDVWLRPVELPPESLPVRKNRSTVPEVPVTRGLRGVCVCGFPSGEQLRPLPKKLFFRYAKYLLERYDEFGIEVDESRFFEALDRYKSDPDEQFADDRLYEKATEEARQ